MKESELEKILVNEVKTLGGRAYKWVSPGNAGVPDRIVILPNQRPIFVELKTDTGRLSNLQGIQIARLENLGQDVRVMKGIGGLVSFLRSVGADENADRINKRYGQKGRDVNGGSI